MNRNLMMSIDIVPVPTDEAVREAESLSLIHIEMCIRDSKNVALLLVSVLKQEQKTKGKARLTNMIKSGKELKVFTIPNKD